MSVDLPVLSDPGSVWLFHGTSTAVADSIVKDGWAPRDPLADIEAFARKNGVPPGELCDEYTRWGRERYEQSVASVSTGWRLAASYARNGPEYLYFARGAIARRRLRVDHWVEPGPADATASVLLLAVPMESLQAAEIEMPPRAALLPDGRNWSNLEPFEKLQSAATEVVVPGHWVEKHLVGIDVVRPQCTCNGTLVLGPEEPNDNRLPCPACFVKRTMLHEP